MTIYDLKLYGVYLPQLAGRYKVVWKKEMDASYVKCIRDGMFAFEATVLKQYGSKQDVLQLQFRDGHTEYVTLHEPAMYLDDGEWKEAKERNVAEMFLEKYEELKEMECIGENMSIFDLTFYGLQDEMGCGIKKVEVFLSRAKRDNALSANSLLFTATVLKAYKAKNYVVKAVTSGGAICYIPLFDDNMYYDGEKKKWEYCPNKIVIPKEILKCYVKYLND